MAEVQPENTAPQWDMIVEDCPDKKTLLDCMVCENTTCGGGWDERRAIGWQ